VAHSITVLKSKLHNARVTHALKDYEGSVALSPELIKLGKFSMHEQVHLWNITQGTRLITYVMEYEGNEEGIICVNGAAAHKANPGDRIILATFAEINSQESKDWKPLIVIMNKNNTQKG
jgi:aspartate 1-decarboxylase